VSRADGREKERNLKKAGYQRFVVHAQGPIAQAVRRSADLNDVDPTTWFATAAFFELCRRGLVRHLFNEEKQTYEYLLVHGPLSEHGRMLSIDGGAP
jgi:hypothetical protein